MEPIAQTVPGAYSRPERLSPAVRLQLTWATSWPGILLDFAYWLVASRSTLPKEAIQYVSLAFGLLMFFAFATWVVRRAIQLDYQGFHLVVLRAGGAQIGRTLTYRESLAVTWLIGWRLAIVTAIPAGVVAILLQRTDIAEGLFGWAWTSAAALVIKYAWLMEAMLRKDYLGFNLRVAV